MKNIQYQVDMTQFNIRTKHIALPIKNILKYKILYVVFDITFVLNKKIMFKFKHNMLIQQYCSKHFSTLHKMNEGTKRTFKIIAISY